MIQVKKLLTEDENQRKKGSIDTDCLSDAILSQQSFCFSSFEEAKATISMQAAECCYDRISLHIYSHNLSPEEFSLLEKALAAKCEERLEKEDQKSRKEYGVLLHMMLLDECYERARIIKKTRPDFVLENERGKNGVEVTEFTIPEDKVLYVISKNNFGQGKSIDEIKRDAVEKHGQKAVEYRYFAEDGINVVSRPMFDTIAQQAQYADEILKKYTSYKASFLEYDRFIILCDGRYAACLSSKSDSENIFSLAKEKNATMCGFTLNILRQDDYGNCVLDSFDV